VDEWPGECVDSQTQCLSRRGWLGSDELQEGDEILTFDLETETTRWATVQRVHRYTEAPYRVWSHRSFAAAVTDNHRWAVRLRPNGSGFPRPYRMTATTEWRSGDEIPRSAPCSDQPVEPKWDDDFVELVAWVACEGYYRPPTRRGNGIVVSQKTHMARVKALMERLGVAPGFLKTDGAWSWEISGSLAADVRQLAPNRAPVIWWLTSLTRRQLLLFLGTCELADGHLVPASGNRKGRRMFSQKLGPILDSWLAATALAGVAVKRHKRGEVESWTVGRSNAVEVRHLQAGPYLSGPVWCPQTEVGTFVARRDGSVFITGNSGGPGAAAPGVLAEQLALGLPQLQRTDHPRDSASAVTTSSASAKAKPTTTTTTTTTTAATTTTTAPPWASPGTRSSTPPAMSWSTQGR
jgi:hypothetical protein